MQFETKNSTPEKNQQGIPVGQGSEINPLNLIRTETVLSKFPRHILSKSGKRPEIRIEKLTPNGKIEMRWYVSYNEFYGPARQLAYDLDTLIIDRSIEETFDDARRSGQVLPRLIPIGSLRDICRKLNLEENGTNTAKIKRALQQNAGTVINAVLLYRGNDGSEQSIDGTFTCYGVFLVGKKLPDGTKADQTYISTTNEYHQVISTSSTRPLDYDYKARLAPTPRRWYELVSFPIYGALKNNHPTAKILYSDYCDRAPHVRYFTFDQVKKQMYKVHRPHLQSGYIVQINYDQIKDEQGRLDWIMHYVPGPKARADHAFITGKKIRSVDSAADRLEAGERAIVSRRRPRQRRLALRPVEVDQPAAAAVPPRAVIIDYLTVSELGKFGISEADARQHLAALPADYPTRDVLEYALTEIKRPGTRIQNPAGFIISLLQQRSLPPSTFESSQTIAARQQAILAQQQALQDQIESEEAAKAAEDAQLDQLKTSHPEEFQALYNQAEAELFAKHPNLARFSKAHPGSILHDGAIRARIRQLLQQGSFNLAPEPESVRETPRASFTAMLQAVLKRPQLKAPKTAPATPENPEI